MKKLIAKNRLKCDQSDYSNRAIWDKKLNMSAVEEIVEEDYRFDSFCGFDVILTIPFKFLAMPGTTFRLIGVASLNP